MLRTLKVCVIVLAPLLVSSVSAQEGLEARRASVRKLARAAQEEQQLVGLAVGVVLDGELAFTEFLGWEDREQQVPVSAETRFRWASISKPVTAVAALQLAQAGKLDLDRDVREYLPEFPEKEHAITARQLLGHLGGVVHYTNGVVVPTPVDYQVEHPFEDVVNALDRFKESPLVAAPGTRYSYTTHGYILLSAVVQRAGGQPYWHQVRERVVQPLELTSLRPDYQWQTIPHRAVGYRRRGDQIVRGSNTDVSWKLGGGGYLSTVEDLAGFAAGLMGEDLLEADTRAMAWTPCELPGGARSSYGLGFGVRSVGGLNVVEHSGSQEKTRTWMRLVPEEGLAVVLMTNSEWAQLRGLVGQLMAALTEDQRER